MIGGIVSHGHAQSITIHGGHYWGMPIIEKMVETFEKNQPDIVLEVANVNDRRPWKVLLDDGGGILVHYQRISVLKALPSKMGIAEYVVGRSGVIVIVNQDNQVNSLTEDQIRLLLSAKGMNIAWKQFGGIDRPAICITAKPWSQTWHIVRRQCMLLGEDYHCCPK